MLLLLCYVPPAVCDLGGDYEKKVSLFEASQFGLPIQLESSDQDGLLETVISGRLEQQITKSIELRTEYCNKFRE